MRHAVVVLVAAQNGFGVRKRPELVVAEDARAGGQRPGTGDQTCIDQVLIGDEVRGAWLHVQSGRHPVGQVRQKPPVLVFQNAPQKPVMRMGVDESGEQPGAAEVDHLRILRELGFTVGSHLLDPVIDDHHGGVSQRPCSRLHGQHGCAAQHQRAGRFMAGPVDVNRVGADGLVGLGDFFRRFLLPVLILFLFRILRRAIRVVFVIIFTEDHRAERPFVELVADGPENLLTAQGPAEGVRADVRDPGQRQAGTRQTQGEPAQMRD